MMRSLIFWFSHVADLFEPLLWKDLLRDRIRITNYKLTQTLKILLLKVDATASNSFRSTLMEVYSFSPVSIFGVQLIHFTSGSVEIITQTGKMSADIEQRITYWTLPSYCAFNILVFLKIHSLRIWLAAIHSQKKGTLKSSALVPCTEPFYGSQRTQYGFLRHSGEPLLVLYTSYRTFTGSKFSRSFLEGSRVV